MVTGNKMSSVTKIMAPDSRVGHPLCVNPWLVLSAKKELVDIRFRVLDLVLRLLSGN
jgi:hypothetical protein